MPHPQITVCQKVYETAKGVWVAGREQRWTDNYARVLDTLAESDDLTEIESKVLEQMRATAEGQKVLTDNIGDGFSDAAESAADSGNYHRNL